MESTSAYEALSQPYHFSISSLEQLSEALLNTDQDMKAMIARFSEYLEYDDIRLYMMTAVRNIITTKLDCPEAKASDITSSFVFHTFEFLRHVRMPTSTDDIGNFVGGSLVGEGEAVSGSEKRRKRKAAKSKIPQARDVTDLVVSDVN